MKTWFQYANHDFLTISKLEFSDKKPVTTLINITDFKYIERLTRIISALPTNSNEIMISFYPIERWELTFCNKDQKCDQVDFYGGKIKTPNTGFYTESFENEKLLNTEINNLFAPQFDTAIQAVTDFEFPFQEFKVIYLGEKHSDPAPVTISTTTDMFRIIPKTGDEIKLDITSGQLSPPPAEFMIGKNKYSLVRYELPSGFRLYPDYFAIIKR